MIKFTEAETAKTKEAARKPGGKIETKLPEAAPPEAAAPKVPTPKRSSKRKAG
jgi:hypothetical protein